MATKKVTLTVGELKEAIKSFPDFYAVEGSLTIPQGYTKSDINELDLLAVMHESGSASITLMLEA